MGEQIAVLLKKGINVRHEGMELILVWAYGIYSIPFLIWLGDIYLRATPSRWRIKLSFIFILAILPAIFIYFLYYKATFK